MTREEAIRILASSCIPGSKQTEALETLIPELAESEDERIRKAIYDFFSLAGNVYDLYGIPKANLLAYLEKQKENPKSADSISADCTSPAKCEERWHKIQDSLPDNGRLVLAKDCLANILLARYDGENWEVSVYDNEDYYCQNTITKWCNIPMMGYKESLHIQESCKENAESLTSPNTIYTEMGEVIATQNVQEQKPEEQDIDVIKMSALLAADRLASAEMTGRLKERSEILDNPTKYGLQKPVEWSEEDKERIKQLIYDTEAIRAGYEKRKESLGDDFNDELIKDCDEQIRWLKSLPERFNLQPKQEWGEEDEACIRNLESIIYYDKKLPNDTRVILGKFLSNLRPQPKKELSIEKAIQWLDDTFYFLDNSSGRGRDCEITTHDFDSLEEMYNSFRKAVTVDSQPHWKPSEVCYGPKGDPDPAGVWKPSEEQMEALKDYADSAIDSQRDIEGNILFSLYDDLKKLTESNFDPKVPSIKEAVIKIVKSISPKVLEYEGFSREQVVKWLYDKEE